MSTSIEGLGVVLAAALLSVVCVAGWRRLNLSEALSADTTFVTSTYPIIGAVYGVFLGFTIVITWGHFRDAESSTTQEVTRLSEVWRTVEPLPAAFRADLQCRLYRYAHEVVESDWDSMAASGRHSPKATERYEEIWDAFYAFSPDSLGVAQATFYGHALDHLNELGRERRRRGLFAGTQVQPVVRALLIGGGILSVLFSLLVPARSGALQMGITALIAVLIAFSIAMALGLERPFSGDLSVTPKAFVDIVESFERRAGGSPCEVPDG